MKKFVSSLGLGLLLGCFGACGSDSGTPHPDGGGPDGGKSGGDGSGSSEVGHSALDVGNQSETSPADVGVADQPLLGDTGIDGSTSAVDGSTADAGTLDVTGDRQSGVDGGSVDAESLNEVGFDSVGPLDGSGLSLVIPQAGEKFSPPLPNSNSLP